MRQQQRCSLCQFRGQVAEIVQLDLPAADAERLRSLAVYEGQLIQLQPCDSQAVIFTAAGARVAVAREVAEHIVVAPRDECTA